MTSRLKKALILLPALLLSLATLQAAPTILAVSYESGDSVLHIGSQMTVKMSFVDNATLIEANVSSSITGSLLIGSVASSPLTPYNNQFVYISDGWRAWVAQVKSGFVAIADGVNILNGTTGGTSTLLHGDNVGDYTTLQNQIFRIYAGNLVTAVSNPANVMPGVVTTTQSPYASIDIGAFDSVVVGDLGGGVDALDGDGVWTASYTVPELGYQVSQANLYGFAVNNGLAAENQPKQGSQIFEIDGLRPDIDLLSVVGEPDKEGYSAVVFLERLSMGTSTLFVTNQKARLDVFVNKKNTVVTVRAKVPATFDKDLQPIALGSLVNGKVYWDLKDGGGLYVPSDGTYIMEVGITDSNGVSGVTKTVKVRVSSLIFEIENIDVAPQTIPTQPVIVGDIITVINFRLRLRTNDPTASLTSAVTGLGFSGAANWAEPFAIDAFGNMTSSVSYRDRVWGMFEIDILDPLGNIFTSLGGRKDGFNLTDTDEYFVRREVGNGSAGIYGHCYSFNTNIRDTFYPGWVFETQNFVVATGDGDIVNDLDWVFCDDCAFVHDPTKPGTLSNPSEVIADGPGTVWIGGTPDPGTYRVQVRGTLAGAALVQMADPPSSNNVFNGCSNTAQPFYRGNPLHFVFLANDTRGKRLFAQDASTVFSVVTVPPVTSDSTAPVLIVSNPLLSSPAIEVGPGEFGTSQTITATVFDPESPVEVNTLVTNISVTGPLGLVNGTSFTNGGTPANSVTVSFVPTNPIMVGGNYTITINTCNIYGLCTSGSPITIPFVVRDEAAPVVTKIEIVEDTGTAYPLDLTDGVTAQGRPGGTGFDGVEEIHVELAMVASSANTIDWTNSTVQLVDIGTIPETTVPITRLAPLGGVVPSDSKLRFRINTPIITTGQYKVQVTTVSNEGSPPYSGPPAPVIIPIIRTQASTNTVRIPYSNNAARIAMSIRKPVTVTAGGFAVDVTAPNAIQAVVIADLSLPSSPISGLPAGFSQLGEAVFWQINNPATLAPGGDHNLTLTYSPVSATSVSIYYDQADLPTGVSHSALVLKGYNSFNSSWSDVFTLNDQGGLLANNFFQFEPLSGAAVLESYALFYPNAVIALTTPAPTATQIVFNNSKSFNPNHAKPIYRQATIYYSDTLVQDVDVKIYNTAGVEVRRLSVANNDISLTNVALDPVYGVTQYFFNWDGRNDEGTQVRNGIYLVRYKTKLLDGTEVVKTQPLAVIK